MKLNINVYYSPHLDPYKNLAVENYLLKSIKENEKYLLFYRNSPCIVFGRFQNPWVEANVDKALLDGIELVRRQSGGGTVYHDLQNLNFCFINSTKDHQKDLNNEILVKALKSLGVDAYASGRSDLRVDIENSPRKFSGSAFKQKKDVSFHHGTLLINSNLTILNEYLRSKLENLEAKGIKSVRSHVINLQEINSKIDEKSLINACTNSFESFYQVDSKFEKIEEFDADYFSFLKSWDWIYGETPLFEALISYENVELSLKIKKGVIFECSLDGMDVHPGLQEEIESKLIGMKIEKKEIKDKFDSLNMTYEIYHESITKLMREFINYFGL